MESASPMLSMLIAQLPLLLLELGFAIALLAMVLVHRAKLGRATTPATIGSGLLVFNALASRITFAVLQAMTMEGHLDATSMGMAYAVVGAFFQLIYGAALILLGLAIIRR